MAVVEKIICLKKVVLKYQFYCCVVFEYRYIIEHVQYYIVVLLLQYMLVYDVVGRSNMIYR